MHFRWQCKPTRNRCSVVSMVSFRFEVTDRQQPSARPTFVTVWAGDEREARASLKATMGAGDDRYVVQVLPPAQLN